MSYIPYATYSREQTSNIITFAQFEEGNLLSEIHDDMYSDNNYDDYSTLPQLISEEEIDAVSSDDESDAEPMSTDMLEDISDSSQYHLRINRRKSHYNIRYCIKLCPSERKGAMLSTKNMGKVLHKVFKAIVNDIFQSLSILGESGSEFSYFIIQPINFAELTRLSEDIKKNWLNATLKYINNLINNNNNKIIRYRKVSL